MFAVEFVLVKYVINKNSVLNGDSECSRLFQKHRVSVKMFVNGEIRISASPSRLSVRSSRKRTQTTKGKCGWGKPHQPTKFGHRGARTVQEAALCLEEFGIDNLLFITLTIAGSTNRAMRTFECWTSFAVNRFGQFLRDALGKGLLYLYVWEKQQRGALHLHYAVCVPPKLRNRFDHEKVRDYWYRVLSDISERSGVDLFERHDGSTWFGAPEFLKVDVQQCRNSVCGYLSKFTSKEARNFDGTSASPGRWYFVSAALQNVIKERRFITEVEVASQLHANVIVDAVAEKLTAISHPLKNPITQVEFGKITWVKPKDVPMNRALLERYFDWLAQRDNQRSPILRFSG